jgi:hypothetical protein
MKNLFTLILILILPLTLISQKYKIREIDVEMQDSVFIVHFELNSEELVDLGMLCFKDSMPPWIFCKTISGDIEKQTSGDKTIIWNFWHDGFLYDDLVESNLVFRVREVEPYAIQRARAEKALAKQKAREKRALKRENDRAEGRIANENLNGNYFGFGSSLSSSGYYGGIVGISYEYRYRIFGINIAVGYGGSNKNLWKYYAAINANTGLKLYLAHKKKVIRNLYFNILPFCYFGQNEAYSIHYVVSNNKILSIEEYKYSHLWGAGAFFGYSPVWHINKKMALGFNINVGVKANYKFDKWSPINWDFGFLIKF